MFHKTYFREKNIYLFWGILLFAFVIRIFRVDSIPAGVNQDEAMGALDAWALSLYGTDRYGTRFPVHFEAWKYGQMSVLLSYCMIPFIKVLGFSTFAIRLPMVIISTIGVALIYLISRKIFSSKFSLAVMAFTAINPWHFMQSRWSLDCNMYPHIFLCAFYLLLCGLEKRKYLYLSMVFFALTFYCYGVAIYSVPVFLLVFAVWCLWKKQVSLKELIISVCIFFVVALPEILVMVINMFGLSTIETPFITMQFFSESIRSNDILFLNFSFYQLKKNLFSMVNQVFLQKPDHLFNALPGFGPMYFLSIPFMFLGIYQMIKSFFTTKSMRERTYILALNGFLLVGIWVGLVTYEVNVNRINIIFYPLIISTVYGMKIFISWFKQYSLHICRAFILVFMCLFVSFASQYFTRFSSEITTMFNVDFLAITKKADFLENYDSLYITSNMGWQTNKQMAEILTQYSCKIDALYYQEIINETGGRTLAPYSERYNFVDIETLTNVDRKGLYLIHRTELEPFVSECLLEYDIILSEGDFIAIDFK